jgi:hypothetical protein
MGAQPARLSFAAAGNGAAALWARATSGEPYESGWRQEPRSRRPGGPDWRLVTILLGAFVVAMLAAIIG